ncbi:MAG: phosphoribosylamine--glycine ligase, partial [Saprospiraceae bacterium]|nr:phosphoribosylamine--glycine ligase [Saprospiraceae bacterium]
MNILILGSGGREHAMAAKIAESAHCSKLFVAPGNPGMNNIATVVNVATSAFEDISNLIKTEKIDIL